MLGFSYSLLNLFASQYVFHCVIPTAFFSAKFSFCAFLIIYSIPFFLCTGQISLASISFRSLYSCQLNLFLILLSPWRLLSPAFYSIDLIFRGLLQVCFVLQCLCYFEAMLALLVYIVSLHVPQPCRLSIQLTVFSVHHFCFRDTLPS